MFFPCQLPPLARLFAVLLNRLEHSPIQPKLNHPQPPAPNALYGNLLILQQNHFPIHQLRCHRPQDFLHFSQSHRQLSPASPATTHHNLRSDGFLASEARVIPKASTVISEMSPRETTQ